MKIGEICKFLSGRRSEIPYISLGDETQPPPEMKASMFLATGGPEIQGDPDEDEPRLPTPFHEMRILKKTKRGKLASLGLISVGLSLTGLVILIDPSTIRNRQSDNASTEASSSSKAISSPPPRKNTV